MELEIDAIESLAPVFGGCGNAAILTDLRRLLSAPFGVVVPETDRIADVDWVLPPSEGLVGGRSLDGDGDAPLRASETVDKDLSFLEGIKGKLPIGGLLAWLDDRGTADGEAILMTISIRGNLYFRYGDDYEGSRLLPLRPCAV